jgi:ribosomal protein S18 acetylase RimI-like enzyme
LVAEYDGRLTGFLIGFLSPGRPDEAYIHFVGVAPDERRAGVGRLLYEQFFELCRGAGRTQVRCVTSPQNTLSIAFHAAMGFEIETGTVPAGPVFAKADYDGSGVHRVAFVRSLLPSHLDRRFIVERHPLGEPIGQDVSNLLKDVFVGEGFTQPEQVGDALDPAILAARGTVWVAKDGAGRAVGVVFLVDPASPSRQVAVPGELEVHFMAVLRSHRRSRVASALLTACVEEARARAARKVVLSTQPSMGAAHALYGRFGFVRTAWRDWARDDGRRYWVFELTLP